MKGESLKRKNMLSDTPFATAKEVFQFDASIQSYLLATANTMQHLKHVRRMNVHQQGCDRQVKAV